MLSDPIYLSSLKSEHALPGVILHSLHTHRNVGTERGGRGVGERQLAQLRDGKMNRRTEVDRQIY